ncbi:DUF3108 domain-containing protein [Arvimicrobium flavum]|uniref:DUF3108 domain-containing protein n=1 Tax=Arvimicrobium flavum TaxID=3393320 RepID=UPI00237B2267|nr:DUF3108 domain-containing protein [Mesorhizobium shangrilense]
MNAFIHRFLVLSVAVLAVVPSASSARTGGKSFRGEYAVTYLGLTVARSSMTSTLRDNAYSIEGSVSTAGLGKIFDDTKATLSVSGRISRDRAVPERAHTSYKHEKKSKSLTIDFAKGNVVGTKVVPPPKPRGPDWVPVTNAQLRAVLDPLSAFLVPASSPEQVCAKPLKLYDGEMRVDLKLRHVETSTVKLVGYEGPAVTCSARFSPVSGYRASKKSIKFMRDRARISITFAPLGTTGVYAPVRASVGTEIGTLTLQARKVEIID